MTSKRTTLAEPAVDLLWMRLLISLVTAIFSPPAVVRSVVPGGMFLPWRALGTTCLNRTAFSSSLLARRPARASSGTFLKASLVGANTVKDPSPLRVSTRSAAFTAGQQGGEPRL